MKLSTLEQLTDAVERIASKLDSQESSQVDLSNYLTKAEASNTYALKNQPVTLGTDEQHNEGAIWIDTSTNTPQLKICHQGNIYTI